MATPAKSPNSPTAGKNYSSGAAGGDTLASRTPAENAKNKVVEHRPAGKSKGKLGGMAS